ncbi:hypothetical protein FOL75_04970 [Bacillus thuringiensis]|nr:hypothetical protein [Bacillus thuringiensis]
MAQQPAPVKQQPASQGTVIQQENKVIQQNEVIKETKVTQKNVTKQETEVAQENHRQTVLTRESLDDNVEKTPSVQEDKKL